MAGTTSFFKNSGTSNTAENSILTNTNAAASSASSAASSATAAANSASEAANTKTAIDNGLLVLTIDAGTFS